MDQNTMMATQRHGMWLSTIQSAFPDQALQQRIFAVATHDTSGTLPTLFEDLARYVLSRKSQQATHEVPTNMKKRKLDDGEGTPSSQANGAVAVGIPKPMIDFECKDISVQIPARKKLKVQLVRDEKNHGPREVRLLNNTTDELEYDLSTEDIDQVFCLPVPEKQQRQSFFAIFPKAGAVGADGMPKDQILFTLNDVAPPSSASVPEDTFRENDSLISVTQRALERSLSTVNKHVIYPDANEFASAKAQSHRKGEKAYHVNAHRGSKEGTS